MRVGDTTVLRAVSLADIYNPIVDGRCVVVIVASSSLDMGGTNVPCGEYSVRVGDTPAVKRKINRFGRHPIDSILLVFVAQDAASRGEALDWLERNESFQLECWELSEGALYSDVMAQYPFLNTTSWSSFNLPHRIMPDLFLSDASSSRCPHLQALGIGAVVNASGVVYQSNHPFRGDVLTVKVDDLPNIEIAQYFDEVITFIKKHHAQGIGVLIHCAAGVSRSTTLLLAYMISERGYTLRDAFLHTHSIRRCVEPNAGFVKQLIVFEHSKLGHNSVSIPVTHNSSDNYSSWRSTSLVHLTK